MPSITEIGSTFQNFTEENIAWQIPDLLSLPEEVDTAYRSPVFSFSDSFWQFEMFPNGETKRLSSGYIGLYLMRLDSGPSKMISIAFEIKGSEVKDDMQLIKPVHFGSGCGKPKFFSRTQLLSKKSNLMPSNTLTIVCKMQSNKHCSTKTSLYNRYRSVCHNMKAILNDKQRTDFKLKFKGREWSVHKVILESRSEYFATMFRHKWKECEKGEVEFKDIEEDALDSVLHFIYTGEVEEMSVKNAGNIFVVAHLFLLGVLKTLCIEYMMENISLDTVCNALAIAKVYEEKELGERAKEYLIPKAKEVFASEEWKLFKLDDEKYVNDFLENIILEKMKKG